MNPPLPQPDERLVEIYSAESAMQARHLCSVLESVGIRAQATGEALQGMPNHVIREQAGTPRIWVLLSQESRARQVLHDELQRIAIATGRATQDEQSHFGNLTENETPNLEAEKQTSQLPDRPVNRFIGNGLNFVLAVAGLCVLVIAGWTAWKNAKLANRYSAETLARVADLGAAMEDRKHAPAASVLPTEYVYTVDGQDYRFRKEEGVEFPRECLVRYNPGQPGDAWVHDIPPPLSTLLLGGILGAFLLLAAWQFRPGATDSA